MFDHIGINVSDVTASKAFYTTLLAPLGHSIRMEFPEHQVYAFGKSQPQFWLTPGRDASRQSGPVHVAFTAKNCAQIDEFHAAGLKAGGKSNGPPGVRAHYHRWYYAAFIEDLDGHNIECVCHWPPPLLFATSWPVLVAVTGKYSLSSGLIVGIVAGGVARYMGWFSRNRL
jgi:predicted lactoylglutathione lyase